MQLKRFTFGFMALLVMLMGTPVLASIQADINHHLERRKHKHHSSSTSDRDCLRKNKRKSKTCAARQISRAVTITKSGSYCLTKDIRGTIVVAASDVTIDLNSHLVNGIGQTAAISVQNQSNVTIRNGSVTNPASLGVQVTGSTGFSLENVQIFGSNNALAMTGSFGSELNNVKVYNNLNVSDALILIDTCDTIKWSNVEVFNNTKNFTVGLPYPNPIGALLGVVNSHNISLDSILINNNTKSGGYGGFQAIIILSSSNIAALNGQLNGNSVLDNEGTSFHIFEIFGCSDIIIDGYQINGNSVQEIDELSGIYAENSPRVVIKNTQISNNSHQAAIEGPQGYIFDHGIWLGAYMAPMDGCVISHCQICRNTIIDGTVQNPDSYSEFTGILVANQQNALPPSTVPTIVENCQINYNSMGGAGKIVAGILIDSTDDCIVRDCQCDYNNGGSYCFGINVIGQPDQNNVPGISKNVRIINCTGNNNTSLGTAAAGLAVCGLTHAPDFTDFVQNLQVIGGQFNYNFGATSGYGIAMQDTKGCSVENCQTDANMSTGVFLGKFIIDDFLSDNPQPINNDATISDCSAKENGANGFELSGIDATNDNCLLQGNISWSNQGVGFLDTSVSLTSRYLSNYSKGNGLLPYLFLDGSIQIFSLDKFGNYTNVSGDAVHFSALVNIQEL